MLVIGTKPYYFLNEKFSYLKGVLVGKSKKNIDLVRTDSICIRF